MISAIFKFEMKYWIKNPLIYVFSAVLFAIPFLTMWGMSAEANTGDNLVMMNSYYKLNNMANQFSLLLIFMLPAILGNSIFRDYSSRIYTVLYSYPFNKKEYLVAKFGSALTVTFIILCILVMGYLLGSLMPGVKEAVILPFDVFNYLQLIFIFLLPNVLFFGIVVFSLSLFTRNIYISFIGVILMIIVQSFGKGVLGASGFDTAAALLDPTGEAAIRHTVRYWTLEERNYNTLPISGMILLNRLFWLAISLLIMAFTYYKFEFSQFNQTRSYKKDKTSEVEIPNKVSFISVPTSTTDFSMIQQLKTAWHLSVIDFRSIVFSWPFISILFAGGMLVIFQQYQMGPQEGIVSIPTTGNMLRFPMFFFSIIVNLLTFLYSGVLIYKGYLSRMSGLLDVTPTPNWVMLLSKLLALIKMQFLLLTLVLLGGLLTQIFSGYYKFEFAHYFFELYLLQGIHFFAWACLAICIHSIAKNLYLGYFLLILIPVLNLILPPIADYLDIEILKSNLIQYNSVKDIFIGFDYSAFNGYGAQLTTYFAYKIYWMLCSFVLVLLALLFWKRGHTFTFLERWKKTTARLSGKMAFALSMAFIAFIGTGFTIYHQEHTVSKIFFSEKDVKLISAENEKRFGHFEHLIQPKLTDVNMTMDIFPKQKDFKLKGVFTYINKTDHPIDTIVIAKSLKEETTCLIHEAHRLLQKDALLNYEVVLLDEPIRLGDSIHIDIEIKNYANSLMHHNSRVIEDGTYIMSNILPVLGIRDAFLSRAKDRKKYGLGPREIKERNPSDSTLLGYEGEAHPRGLIQYECVMSTDQDQTPITMGTITKSWNENGRTFHHYKADGPIINTMSWMSGQYQKQSSEGKHQALEMYRHPDQGYNDPHFFNGLNASLDYCSDWFGALSYDTMKIVEFPETEGTYATVNGNLIPYSETYFKCDVHDHENDVFNMPFFVSAHEIAHCWWGHRVDPAHVSGGKIITEGMADYIAMKAIDSKYEEEKVFEFRKKYHKLYLETRARQASEQPLIHSSLNNEYLNYQKASLAIYAMSEYIGEEKLNGALAHFEKKYKHAPPPYATSLDFVHCIKEATPDSLQYLVHDMFETITLYDNAIRTANMEFKNGVSSIKLDLEISKYRTDQKGKHSYGDSSLQSGEKKSLPLSDYVEVGFYGVDNTLIEKRIILIHKILSTHEFEIEGKVSRITLDPNYLLFTVNRDEYEKHF